MPHLDINGARLHYTDEGSGKETILFSHGLLFSGAMFGAQVAALNDRYRCITYDHRGQGQSEVTDSGYDIEALTDDAAALIEALDIGPCHFVGLSMGGFVGMRLAARKSHLLRSLTLIETSADEEPRENVPRYGMLNFIARWFGLSLVAGKVMPIMFGQSFLNDPARAAERDHWRKFIISNDRLGITRAVKGVIDRQGVHDELANITLPTLIMVGDEDVATVPEKSHRMHAAIPDSQLVIIPRAGQSSTIEESEAITTAMIGFLQRA